MGKALYRPPGVSRRVQLLIVCLTVSLVSLSCAPDTGPSRMGSCRQRLPLLLVASAADSESTEGTVEESDPTRAHSTVMSTGSEAASGTQVAPVQENSAAASDAGGASGSGTSSQASSTSTPHAGDDDGGSSWRRAAARARSSTTMHYRNHQNDTASSSRSTSGNARPSHRGETIEKKGTKKEAQQKHKQELGKATGPSGSSAPRSKGSALGVYRCGESVMEFLHRAVMERRSVERGYWDALGQANELEANYTRRAAIFASNGPYPRKVGERLKQRLDKAERLAKEAKAVADRKKVELMLFDEATWSEHGGSLASICLEEAEEFRYFLLHHKTREQDEAEYQAAAEQRRKKRMQEGGQRMISEQNEELLRELEKQKAAMELHSFSDLQTLPQKAMFVMDLAASTIFPPIFILQQVLFAVARYHLWEYGKVLLPWAEKHFPWAVPERYKRFQRSRGPTPPLSEMLADSPAVFPEDEIASVGFAAEVLWSLVEAMGQRADNMWLAFAVAASGIVSFLLFPLLVLCLYLRDALYGIFFSRFLMQHLLGFTKPLHLTKVFKLLLLDLSAAAEEIVQIGEHLERRWGQRDQLFNAQTLIGLETMVLVCVVSFILFLVLDRWARINLALVW